MFRIASIVLLAASLCSVATAQTAELDFPKNPIKQAPSAKGTVKHEPLADGTVKNEPSADGTVTNADVQPKPVDKPLPINGVVYLKMSVDDIGLHAFVHGAKAGFVGVVGLSLTPDLTHSFAGLPPLLTNAVVMAYGFTSSQDLELKAPILYWPAEVIMVYGQAVIIDEHGLWASGIVPLAIGKDGNGTDKVPADRAAQTKAKAANLAPAIN